MLVLMMRYQFRANSLNVDESVLNHVLGDTVDLLFRLYAVKGLKVETLVAFKQARSDALQHRAVFSRR